MITEPAPIRPADRDDAEVIAVLSAQLGYPTDVREVRKRLNRIGEDTTSRVMVAARVDGSVVGWIHVFESLRVEANPFAELGGLVVDEQERNKGIGRRLVEAAESWALQRGLTKLRIRSNVTRGETHNFYRRLDFEETKSQKVFDKQLRK